MIGLGYVGTANAVLLASKNEVVCFDLDKRIPILSVGSNRSPYQLKRKFSLDQDISVTPATLYDSDIVYARPAARRGQTPRDS